MRSLRTALVILLASAGATAAPAAADQAGGAVVVTAQFSSRTSLKVSARLLRFDVPEPGAEARAAVEFVAGARTTAGAEVLLSVEPVRAVDGPGGAADVETSLSFAGEGAGTLGGPIAASGPTIAGRWSGSGRRSGRLVFSLRAGATGTYSVPLRFVLSAP
jgi:hypothetical protein